MYKLFVSAPLGSAPHHHPLAGLRKVVIVVVAVYPTSSLGASIRPIDCPNWGRLWWRLASPLWRNWRAARGPRRRNRARPAINLLQQAGPGPMLPEPDRSELGLARTTTSRDRMLLRPLRQSAARRSSSSGCHFRHAQLKVTAPGEGTSRGSLAKVCSSSARQVGAPGRCVLFKQLPLCSPHRRQWPEAPRSDWLMRHQALYQSLDRRCTWREP